MGTGSHRRCEICGFRERRKRKDQSLLFATFPVNEGRCREWLRLVGNDELVHLPIEKLVKKYHVCGNHFLKKDFNKKGTRLKKTAIPVLNLIAAPLSEEQLSEFPQRMWKNTQGVPTQTSSATATAFISANGTPTTAELPSASFASSPGTSSPTNSAAFDGELRLLLGDSTQTRSSGENIQPDLALLLQYIARTGLPIDVHKELMDKHFLLPNSISVEAPTLNPEVAAALSKAARKRDKEIEFRQKQRTSAMSCVAKALTSLVTSEPQNTSVILPLIDAIKLMCDSQYTDSTIRRNFVLKTLSKDVKDQLQATKIDKLLFSGNLPEILKGAKVSSKSGADVKPASLKQPIAKNKPPLKRLNWRGIPKNHRPKETVKIEPAIKILKVPTKYCVPIKYTIQL